MSNPTHQQPIVSVNRRTMSGRYMTYSRDADLDNEVSSAEYSNYHVHIPMTPDRDVTSLVPMDPSISVRVEEQYVSNSLFTGGSNNMTQAHLMDKVTESDTAHPDLPMCSIIGCDQKFMSDEKGEDVLPCECDFKICVDCFKDAVKGDGLCPRCKEVYRATDLEEVLGKAKDGKEIALNKMGRRLSMMKSSGMDFDHNRWLFETKGTYRYGNAIWPSENDGGDEGDRGGSNKQKKELLSKPWRPLNRKLKIPSAVLSPYKLLIRVQKIQLKVANFGCISSSMSVIAC